MNPMTAPEKASHINWRAVAFSPVFFPDSFIKAKINRPPRIPLEKATNAEERGIYLRNTPIEPNMTIEETNMATDFGSFLLPCIDYIPLASALSHRMIAALLHCYNPLMYWLSL